MLERKESHVTIFRGDDTGGQLGKTIVINFHCDETVDMEGVVVTFVLGGFYEKEFLDVHDGDKLEIFMTHEQTAKLPLGVSFGKLYGTDASGKIRTFSNRIPIRVTNHVHEAYGDAEESGIDVTISNAITWDSIYGKPETFPPSEHRHQKSDIDDLEDDLQTLSDGVESAIEAAEEAKTEAEKGVRTVNGKSPTDGNVKIVLDDLADNDGNIETTKTILVSRGGSEYGAVALLVDLFRDITEHNDSPSAHSALMATIARVFATKTEIANKYNTTGGPISGDVSISGSLSLTGATPKIEASQNEFSFPTESGTLARAEDYYTTEEVDDKITRFVAHYLTRKDSSGRFVPFATHAELAYAKQHHTASNPQFYYAGEPFTPTKNDYCVVLEDETVENKTTRYSYVGDWPTGAFQYQYTINDTAFSESQWAAINSGVTEEWMASTLSAATTADSKAAAAQSTADEAQSAASSAQEAADGAIADITALPTVAHTGSYNDLTDKPELATVATTGYYDDLNNLPTIPTEAWQVNALPSGTTAADIGGLAAEGTAYDSYRLGGSEWYNYYLNGSSSDLNCGSVNASGGVSASGDVTSNGGMHNLANKLDSTATAFDSYRLDGRDASDYALKKSGDDFECQSIYTGTGGIMSSGEIESNDGTHKLSDKLDKSEAANIVPKRLKNDDDTSRIDGEGNVYEAEFAEGGFFTVKWNWGYDTYESECKYDEYSSGEHFWKSTSSPVCYVRYRPSDGILNFNGWDDVTVTSGLDPLTDGVVIPTDTIPPGGHVIEWSFTPQGKAYSGEPSDRFARESELDDKYALKSDLDAIRYPIVSVTNGQLVDRAVNVLTVSNNQTINAPSETVKSGVTYARDFVVRIEVGSTAPSGYSWGFTPEVRSGDSWDTLGLLEANKKYIYRFTDVGGSSLMAAREEVA